MTKRGGRTTRGGRETQEERDGEIAHNSETHRFSNVNPSQSANQENDIIGETEQQSGSGHLRAKRGITCGKGTWKAMKAAKTRLKVEYNFEARRAYKEWRRVPQDVREPLRHKLLTLFDIDVEDPNVCKVIDSCMASAFRGYQSELHCYFKEIGGQEDLNKAKTTRPPACSRKDWEYLCNMCSEPKYQETAQKRKIACEKRKNGK